MKRRKFLGISALSMSALSMFPADLLSISRELTGAKIEKRSLGNTGEMLSSIGFGGIVVMNATPEQSSRRVSQAIDYGVNYFDVAPTYGDAEIKLGPALKPYRKTVFLACKTKKRDKTGAKKELEQSLKNLETDYFDLYQLHAVKTVDEVKQIFASGGAIETFTEARKEGKVKYLGFSAHSVEAALALMNNFDFDTLLFPFNFATWHAGNFGPQVMETAKQKEMGILALKAMAWRPWPKGIERDVKKVWYQPLDPDEANMGLRFTLSHPVTSAIPPGNENLFALALDLATKFEPMDKDEILKVKERGLNTTPLFTYPQGT
jgi:predicted aldo/keto reductase-like oxidoreductase